MHKSDSPDRDRALTEVELGALVRVVAVRPGEAERLARHGIRPGASLVVDQDAPLGGPRIVRAGSTRLAIARPLARDIVVRPVAR